ncbi:hypothetical protein CathTA2_1734 [Caldalkalibacillus thermarum TA2.A1]|uniref:Uncharacterized protein n=1 Tax=Caldalkalibacillus thermarum (strain TA2.A1) TaxID=986075 RepID=F5L7D4_CALTT|nr:hypothetical protein [Caldalkalibacillus thermarum]EGL82726.1 hypothetical protein CathTA2_1734 [Caldalkalibacillus thermarum TA2.A1]QZT32573.1 hypothetical protein HUR95_09150 [Caldalkalibacillus thermarum TA2.A1]
MNIRITNIRVNAITNIGSLNIGKTIICQNRATATAYYRQFETRADEEVPLGEVPDPGQVAVPPPTADDEDLSPGPTSEPDGLP